MRLGRGRARGRLVGDMQVADAEGDGGTGARYRWWPAGAAQRACDE